MEIPEEQPTGCLQAMRVLLDFSVTLMIICVVAALFSSATYKKLRS